HIELNRVNTLVLVGQRNLLFHNQINVIIPNYIQCYVVHWPLIMRFQELTEHMSISTYRRRAKPFFRSVIH
ncbi:MAG: hypothetical protein OSB25_12335, partial [Salibacteraceae bacterium]|nr:hypothetical protein [Salibacteraceae bacterium]